ncbi:MAG: thiamine ABC transporter substrate-binding protein [Actinobacteria bacterium]|nr:thiamine ABC transporter substrate-binding protein [Actinomycetota bacterium]
MIHRRSTTRLGALALVSVLALVACSDDAADAPTDTTDTTQATDATDEAPVTITLVTYDSFPAEGTSLNDALASFTASTGIEVELVIAGDTGTMVSKAVLTAGNPEGDVMWGVDNTSLSRALPAFEPYTSAEIDALDPALTALVPGGELTPVDFGDVCINTDLEWFTAEGLEPPTTFADLVDPAYADLLTVQNPATSSPGLAFLLATVAEFGADGWQAYWTDLRDNGVEVVDSWTTAYYERFSGSSGDGPSPLVVSYASSPPAEVIFADPPRDDAPTGVMTETCFRQVEFAGVLAGTDHPEQAQRLVDFLASAEFQQEVALNLFVWPARTDVAPPPEFVEFADVVDTPLTVAPEDIETNREVWLDEWTQIVLR